MTERESKLFDAVTDLSDEMILSSLDAEGTRTIRVHSFLRVALIAAAFAALAAILIGAGVFKTKSNLRDVTFEQLANKAGAAESSAQDETPKETAQEIKYKRLYADENEVRTK